MAAIKSRNTYLYEDESGISKGKQCGQRFPDNKQPISLMAEHSVKHIYRCMVDRSSLKAYMRTHLSEKPLLCICLKNKKFLRKGCA